MGPEAAICSINARTTWLTPPMAPRSQASVKRNVSRSSPWAAGSPGLPRGESMGRSVGSEGVEKARFKVVSR